MKPVDKAAWIEARLALLEKEKQLTRMRDEVAAARREMPWRLVETEYEFADAEGVSSLAQLFGDKTQLVVYHYMYGPGWKEGCKSCSFWADQYDAINYHIGARDVALAVVSRAPWQDFQEFKKRMGWGFKWMSSFGNTFNTDYNVSFPGVAQGDYNFKESSVMEEMPGLSVFAKDETGAIFHTYSVYARGLDPLNATYQILDLVPKGRDEADLPFGMSWLNFHDQYG